MCSISKGDIFQNRKAEDEAHFLDEEVIPAYESSTETQNVMKTNILEEEIKTVVVATPSAVQEKPAKLQHEESITKASISRKEKCAASNEDGKKNDDNSATTAIVVAVLAIAIGFILYHMLRHKS